MHSPRGHSWLGIVLCLRYLGVVVGNAIVEFPLALMIRKLPARFVFGPTVTLFGLVATLMVVSGGFGGVMVLRFLLGCGEGILTMAFIYLGQGYKADELALRYC